MIFISIVVGLILFSFIVIYYDIKKRLVFYKSNYDKIKPDYDTLKAELEVLNDRIEALTKCIIEKDNLYETYKNRDAEQISLMYADMVTLQYYITEQTVSKKNIELFYKTGKEREKILENRDIYYSKLKKIERNTAEYLKQYKCLLYKYEVLLEVFPDINKYVDNFDSLKSLNDFSSLQRNEIFHTLRNKIEEERQALQEERIAISEIVKEASIGSTKWLASLIADYHSLADRSLVEEYQRKKHPISVSKARELYSLIDGELKTYRVQNKELEYLVAFYQEQYPELAQSTPESLFENDQIENIDQIEMSENNYYRLSQEEYAKLVPAEKSQLALDSYWKKRKAKWVIGRDYERFIGFYYEQLGYKVYYQGIKKKKEDLGIDLVCQDKDKILLVQCKYWKSGFPVRENAINQLYGTSMKYTLDNQKILESPNTLFPDFDAAKPIEMWLITSSELSETAKEFANVLGVKFKQNQPLDRYPIIKCNVSSDGKKIYHLPFDQMYDQTTIEPWRGESYEMTVKEAENKGFRRAFRWHA